MYKTLVLLSLCFALASAKPAADTSLGLFSAVEELTGSAHKALAALPAACTRSASSSIQEAKIKVLTEVATCNVAAIIKDFAYIIIDGTNFGSAAWSDGKELVAEVRACMRKDTFMDKVECLAGTFSNSSDAFQGIVLAVKDLVEQLLVIIPDIESKIKTCQRKSTSEYTLFLDGLVNKVTTSCQN